MSFVTAIVVAYNGERGIAYDAYDNPIWFTRTQVHPDDEIYLDVGMQILYNSNYSIEIASSSFSRYAISLPAGSYE